MIISSINTQAGVGVITVLEAPIQLNPRLNSKVIQYARKGDQIYIPSKYFLENQVDKILAPSYRQGHKYNTELWQRENLSYFEVMDNNGRKAYILKDHVKLIYNDEREFNEPINAYDKDPTDYRIAEPLQKDFPFVVNETYRSGLDVTYGPNMKTGYQYNVSSTEAILKNRIGARFYYLKNANWDKQNRFYFGGVAHWWTSSAEYYLTDGRSSVESTTQAGIGPHISYDLWRRERFRITSEGSLIFSYTNRVVSQESTFLDSSEERTFSGLSLMPKLATTFSIRNVVPGLDLVTGIEVQAYIPHRLTSGEGDENSVLWNSSSNDQIDIPFNAYWNVFLGFRSQY